MFVRAGGADAKPIDEPVMDKEALSGNSSKAEGMKNSQKGTSKSHLVEILQNSNADNSA